MSEQEIKKGEVIIYKASEGPELQVQMDGETVWLTRNQMAELFDKDVNTIGDHIRRIYAEKELELAKTTLKQGKTGNTGIALFKPNIYYNLDVIISVGYRVRSKRGTQFRIWATQRLRDYIIRGYTVNQERLKQLKQEHNVQLKELQKTTNLFHQLIESQRANGYEKDLLNIIVDYANTWALLNKYDEGNLEIESVSKKSVRALNHKDIQKTIERFKTRLMAKKEASELFGQEVGGKLEAVLGSIYQTYEGKELYASVEEKAAHLFYFAIKDHPFVDGNKRIASLLFLLFLVENNYLMSRKGERKINDTALVALALLIAESKPDDKNIMVKLIVNLINKK